MPTYNEISVVAQGPIVGRPGDPEAKRLTLRCLESVRRHLPGCEIVLSTWRGSDVSGLPFDRLIESEDPGGTRGDDGSVPGGYFYNCNRQITSTRAGLQAATRPYAMKLRSDMVLTGTGFLRYFRRYTARNPEWNILRDRVVVPNFYTRNPRRRLTYPFHPSDWFHFGWREDVLKLWDIPLADEPELARWFATRPRAHGDTEQVFLYRYTLEQYLWLSFLRKHGPVEFDHKLDLGHDSIRVSELTIANNLVVAEVGKLGLKFLKAPISLVEWATLYSHAEWQLLYREHCDPAFRRPAPWASWRKEAYNAYFAPAQRVLGSPRALPVAGALSSKWEKRFPRSFRMAKKTYISGLDALNRLVS